MTQGDQVPPETLLAADGRIVARVWRQDEGGHLQLSSSATVVLKHVDTGQVIPARRDSIGDYAASPPSGAWLASASDVGAAAARPQTMEVLPGRQTVCEFVLRDREGSAPRLLAIVGVELNPGSASVGRSEQIPFVRFVPAGSTPAASAAAEVWELALLRGGDQLEVLDKAHRSDGEFAAAGGPVDVDSKSVQQAAQRAVALLNRQQGLSRRLIAVERCAVEEDARGVATRLQVALADAAQLNLQNTPTQARLRSATEGELSAAGLSESTLSQSWRWFIAEPEEPLLGGSYFAEAEFWGYHSAVSVTRMAIPGQTTMFDLRLSPVLPQVDLFVESPSDSAPVDNLTCKFVNVDAQQTLAQAVAVKTDASGAATATLAAGIGAYNLVVSGPGLRQLTKQFVIEQPRQEIHLRVFGERERPSYVFSGTVWVESLERTTRTVESTDDDGNATLKAVVEDRVSKSPLVGAQVLFRPADDAIVSTESQRPVVAGQDGTFTTELPEGEYLITVRGENCSPHAERMQVRADVADWQCKLAPCNKILEQGVVGVLTEGWRSLPRAKEHYTVAAQSDTASPAPDYAVGLLLMHSQHWADALRYLQAATDGKQGASAEWSRAAEAWLWLSMYRGEMDSVQERLPQLAKVLGQHHHQASDDAVSMMGCAVGMLLGPWRQRSDDGSVDELNTLLESQLAVAHRRIFVQARDQLLTTYEQAKQQLTQAARASEEQAIQQILANDDRLAEIEQQIRDLVSVDESERIEAANICEANRQAVVNGGLETRWKAADTKRRWIESRIKWIEARLVQLSSPLGNRQPPIGGDPTPPGGEWPAGGDAPAADPPHGDWPPLGGGTGGWLTPSLQFGGSMQDPLLEEQRALQREHFELTRQRTLWITELNAVQVELAKRETECRNALLAYHQASARRKQRLQNLQRSQKQLVRSNQQLEEETAAQSDANKTQAVLGNWIDYVKYPCGNGARSCCSECSRGVQLRRPQVEAIWDFVAATGVGVTQGCASLHPGLIWGRPFGTGLQLGLPRVALRCTLG